MQVKSKSHSFNLFNMEPSQSSIFIIIPVDIFIYKSGQRLAKTITILKQNTVVVVK